MLTETVTASLLVNTIYQGNMDQQDRVMNQEAIKMSSSLVSC